MSLNCYVFCQLLCNNQRASRLGSDVPDFQNFSRLFVKLSRKKRLKHYYMSLIFTFFCQLFCNIDCIKKTANKQYILSVNPIPGFQKSGLTIYKPMLRKIRQAKKCDSKTFVGPDLSHKSAKNSMTPFLQDGPNFVPAIWEYRNFSVRKFILTLLQGPCSPGNQDYQKIIYVFFDNLKYIRLIISRYINNYN